LTKQPPCQFFRESNDIAQNYIVGESWDWSGVMCSLNNAKSKRTTPLKQFIFLIFFLKFKGFFQGSY
jgi:hypothetical protein